MGRLLLASIGILATAILACADDPKLVPRAQPKVDNAAPETAKMSRIKAELKNDRQKASYAIGFSVGANARRQGADALEIAAFLLGIQDAMSGMKPSLTAKESDDALKSFRDELQQRQAKRMAEAAAINRKKGEDFLAANKKKPGVVTLPDGVQYQILKKGNGKKPKATDRVEVHYTGTLVDGTVFQSTVERNEPANFTVNEVIRGWGEVLQLMKEGDKWRVFIPTDLAYGAQGKGTAIGPNESLIFEIELLKVK